MPYKCDIARRAAYAKRCGTCVDCGARCGAVGATRCKTCSNKSRTFRQLESCRDCNVKLKSFYAERCQACHNVTQNRGLSRERTLFNVSSAWAQVRQACFVRDDFTCLGCGARGGYLHAHHFMTYAEHPNLRLSLTNLVTLCKPCHKFVHFGKR